jgi:3-oxoacyl-[acyl-carrier protein] reductase
MNEASILSNIAGALHRTMAANRAKGSMSNSGRQPLSGRNAVVTGAASGIGLACALLLAEQGASVAALDVRGDALTPALEAIALAGSAIGTVCDVSDEHSVTTAMRSAAAELGGLDTVVTAAGIARPSRLDELSLAEWETVLRVNLTGTFLVIKCALPALLKAGGGAIVTVGSVCSLVAGTSASYDASKGGVLQLTRAVAAEYADRGIRANCVCPGWVDTSLRENSQRLHGPMRGSEVATYDRVRVPLERHAAPSEIASVVAFLCSDEASFMTGAAVPVDGGYTAI